MKAKFIDKDLDDYSNGLADGEKEGWDKCLERILFLLSQDLDNNHEKAIERIKKYL